MDVALTPHEVELAEKLIRDELQPGTNYHALRTRKAGPRRFIEFHLLVPGTMSVIASHELCDRIESSLAARLSSSSR
jgi:divalent metal cation (Fe/Co/Zn/Cd) transporter